ncbi:MAG: c-type cytochrome biogenesis protein CcmI [Rhodospirillales bacterium]
MMLWVLIGGLTVCALAILLVPVWRAGHRHAAARADYDLAVYRDQLEELERDKERGVLSDREYAAAVLEVQRRLLAASAGRDGSARDGGAAAGTAPRRRLAVVATVAVLLPAGAFATYALLGSPAVPDYPFAAREAGKQVLAGQNMEALLERLQARLDRQPNDIRGWFLLGRSSMSLGKYDQAVQAYKKAIALGANDPDLAIDYAEALTAAAGSTIPEEARKIFADAVVNQPLNTKARYYVGLAQAQRGDLRGALQTWIDLKAISPEGAPWRIMVEGQIARAGREAGIDPATIEPSEAVRDLMRADKGPDSAPRGPTAEDVKAASQMSSAERAAFIRSMVERLAARLKDNPNDRAGWMRLARAYEVLGEKEKAKAARERANALLKR